MSEDVEASGAPEAPAAVVTAQRAISAPMTVDRASRTVEVVWSTGARARNYIPSMGVITEELDMSPNAVRLDALRSGGAPVLNSHRRGDARDVVGRVASARVERGRGYATLRFTTAEDAEPIWQRIVDGTLRGISVGYHVHRYDAVIDRATGETVHRAVDWEPFEISVVPVPVDRDAGVRCDAQRGALAFAVEQPLEKDTDMNEKAPPAAAEAAASAPAAVSETAVRAEPPPVIDVNAVRAEAIKAERERIAAIDEAAESARALLPADVIASIRADAIERGLDGTATRDALFKAVVERQAKGPPGPHVKLVETHEDPAVVIDAMADAIAKRAMPSYTPANPRFEEFRDYRPSDMIRALAEYRNERNVTRNVALLAQRAFHTTSDFPLLLSAAANKMLLAAYQPVEPVYRLFFMRRDFRDFKPHRHLRVGDFPALRALGEGGEIQVGTISEGQETVTLVTYARRVRVTRQMLVNDDLGAFTDFASMIGRRIADFEDATAMELLNTQNGDGPLLADGTRVFSTAATRANKASTGTTLTLESLSDARAAILRQRTLDGMQIGLGRNMFLVVGPNRELAARQLTVSFTPTQASNANVYAGLIQPVVEPLIPGNRWYLFADPMSAPVYTYGFLNGANGPSVSNGPVQGADAIEIAVTFDFGVGAVDFRGGYFNPGN